MIQRKQTIYLFLAGLVSMLFAINFDKLFDLTLNFLSDPAKGDTVFSFAFFVSAFISFVATSFTIQIIVILDYNFQSFL